MRTIDSIAVFLATSIASSIALAEGSPSASDRLSTATPSAAPSRGGSPSPGTAAPSDTASDTDTPSAVGTSSDATTPPVAATASARVTEASTDTPSEREKKHSTLAIVANPLGLLFGFYNADLGLALSEKTSANLSGSYWSLDVLGIKTTAWGVGVGAQYFFYRKLFDGAFVYPAIEFARTTISIGDLNVSGTLFGPSALVGYQWNFHPFTARLGLGGQYFIGNVGEEGFESSLQGVGFKADGSIGCVF